MGTLPITGVVVATLALSACSTPPSLYQPAHTEGIPDAQYRVDLSECRSYERGTRLYAAVGALAGGVPIGALGAAAAAGVGGGIAAGVSGVDLLKTPAGIIGDCMRRKGYAIDG